jgi:hypothetical protein
MTDRELEHRARAAEHLMDLLQMHFSDFGGGVQR